MGYFTELGRRFLAEADDPEAPKATFASEPSEPTPVKTPEDIPQEPAEEITQPANTTGVDPVVMPGSGTATRTQPPGRQVVSGKEHDALQQRLAELADQEENPIEKSHGRGAATAEDHFCSSPADRWRQDHKQKGSQNRTHHKNRRVIPSRDSTFFSVETGTT
jgi:hypothetical protein